eukprot:TRINITY_DN465_c0_g1_i3.p1 TRINITY_DN465_c0_g1~~TRINITY_DN465_c0_g1_i3.p1  ORF type:complete len:242 (-),score=20.63 TRINITY_DN465_c0_g1_i3:175-900(-)
MVIFTICLLLLGPIPSVVHSAPTFTTFLDLNTGARSDVKDIKMDLSNQTLMYINADSIFTGEVVSTPLLNPGSIKSEVSFFLQYSYFAPINGTFYLTDSNKKLQKASSSTGTQVLIPVNYSGDVLYRRDTNELVVTGGIPGGWIRYSLTDGTIIPLASVSGTVLSLCNDPTNNSYFFGLHNTAILRVSYTNASDYFLMAGNLSGSPSSIDNATGIYATLNAPKGCAVVNSFLYFTEDLTDK